MKGPRPHGHFDVSHDAERPSAGEEEQGWRTRTRAIGRKSAHSEPRSRGSGCRADVGRNRLGNCRQAKPDQMDKLRLAKARGGTGRHAMPRQPHQAQAQDGRRTSRSRMGAPVKPRDGAGSRACVKLVFTRDLVPSGVSGVVQRSKDHPVWVGCSNRGAKSGVVSRCCETAPCDRHVVDRARHAVFSSGAVRH